MSDELAVLPPLQLKEEREQRKALRRKERQGRLTDIMLNLQESAARDVALKGNIFRTDEELIARGYTEQQIKKIRAWEKPKKEVPYALEASTQHVTSMLRRENDQKRGAINIEKLIVRLPDRGQADLPPPITIEAEAVSK